MAGRPRRRMKQIDYRRVHLYGLEEDSSEEEGNGDEDNHEIVAESDDDGSNGEVPDSDSEVDEIDSDSDDDDPESYTAPDGSTWTSKVPTSPLPGWRSNLINFNDGPIGAANLADAVDLKPADILKLMLPDAILQDICDCTNEFAQHNVDEWNKAHPQEDPKQDWQLLTVVELRGFIGLCLLGGIEKPRRKPWSEMWSTNRVIRSPPFPATLAKTRFFNIMSSLRFDHVFQRRARKLLADEDPSVAYDKTEPIKNIFNQVVSSFSSLYDPGSKLCVDEQIVKFRGNCPFRVYMPAKPGKYGIKIWALVDSASGYILNLQIYQGQVGSSPEVGQGKRVVLDLVEKYFFTHRGIIADNFFTSFDLLKELLDVGLTYCGTLRKNRREVPGVAKDLANCSSGSSLFLFNPETNSTLVRYMPKSNRYVLLLSSAHYSNTIFTTTKGKVKPIIIAYYNAMKGGVDTADEMLSNYTSQFPSKRWSMKLFLHLIDCCAYNAFRIWMRLYPKWMETSKSKRRSFIRQLSYDLVKPQIRFRSLHTPNLHKHIREAMEIMGIGCVSSASQNSNSYRQSGSRATSEQHKVGRCAFDSPYSAQQQQSRTKCQECMTFICPRHQNKLCPDCFENRETV